MVNDMTANEYKNLVDSKLSEFFNPSGMSYDGLLESMHYSLTAGGKRIRPTLVLEFCRISGGDVEKALPVACAIEMLHTYSLIHDDLPCMDNDDLRRGKPTNHVVYGECTATLAGDALQAEAFGTIARSELPAENKIACVEILADAVGSDGMCAGQYLDMVGESKRLTEEELDDINSRKPERCLLPHAVWALRPPEEAERCLKPPHITALASARHSRYVTIFWTLSAQARSLASL